MPTVGVDNGSTPRIPLYCVLSSDHLTPATGKTVAVTISKNGAAFGNPSAGATNATEIGHGWYYVDLSGTDTGTNGPLLVLGTNAATDDATRDYTIATATSAPPTVAQIATGVWQDTTSGDFTVSGSIGKSLFTSGNAPGTSSGLFITSSYTAAPTAVAVATAVWTDTTGSDFTVLTSPGKIIFAQLGGSFTSTSSSVFTIAALANAPGGGGAVSSVNVTQWHGEAVPLPNISGVPIVDMSYIDGTSSVGSPGYIGIDWGYIDHPTTTQNLSNTTINSSGGGGTDVNVVSWDGHAVATPNVDGVPIVDLGYVLGEAATLYQGTVQSATSNSVTLDPSEPAIDGYYNGAIISIRIGTGVNQWRYIPSYSASRVATVHRPWVTNPDVTSKYVIEGLAQVDAYAIEQPALAQFFTVDSGQTHSSAVSGSVVKETSLGAGGGTDPWLTSLPGSYSFGMAGYILGTYLDAQVSSRSTYGGTDTPGIVTLLTRIGGPITINGGAVAIDWAHVANPTSTVNLSNTTISNSQVVASVTGNVTVGGLTAEALAQFFTVDTGEVYADAIPGSVVKEIATNASGGGTSDLTAAEVWAYATRTLTSLGATAPVGWINADSIVDHALDGKGDWSTYAGGDTTGVTTLLTRISGNITIVAGGVNINLAQTLGAARSLNAVADTSLTLNDVGHSAIAAAAGQESVVGLVYTVKTPFTATIIRTFTLDSGTAPKVRT